MGWCSAMITASERAERPFMFVQDKESDGTGKSLFVAHAEAKLKAWIDTAIVCLQSCFLYVTARICLGLLTSPCCQRRVVRLRISRFVVLVFILGPVQ